MTPVQVVAGRLSYALEQWDWYQNLDVQKHILNCDNSWVRGRYWRISAALRGLASGREATQLQKVGSFMDCNFWRRLLTNARYIFLVRHAESTWNREVDSWLHWLPPLKLCVFSELQALRLVREPSATRTSWRPSAIKSFLKFQWRTGLACVWFEKTWCLLDGETNQELQFVGLLLL